MSLPVCAEWSELLFSLGDNCVALQLQFCLVRSSPSKVGQFSFECCPLSQEISSRIHCLLCFGRLACFPTSTLSLCASPNLYWVLVLLLWEVSLLSHSCSQPLLLYPRSFTENSVLRVWLLAPPSFSRVGSAFHPYLLCWC
jgi:hypothetical protein